MFNKKYGPEVDENFYSFHTTKNKLIIADAPILCAKLREHYAGIKVQERKMFSDSNEYILNEALNSKHINKQMISLKGNQTFAMTDRLLSLICAVVFKRTTNFDEKVTKIIKKTAIINKKIKTNSWDEKAKKHSNDIASNLLPDVLNNTGFVGEYENITYQKLKDQILFVIQNVDYKKFKIHFERFVEKVSTISFRKNVSEHIEKMSYFGKKEIFEIPISTKAAEKIYQACSRPSQNKLNEKNNKKGPDKFKHAINQLKLPILTSYTYCVGEHKEHGGYILMCDNRTKYHTCLKNIANVESISGSEKELYETIQYFIFNNGFEKDQFNLESISENYQDELGSGENIDNDSIMDAIREQDESKRFRKDGESLNELNYYQISNMITNQCSKAKTEYKNETWVLLGVDEFEEKIFDTLKSFDISYDKHKNWGVIREEVMQLVKKKNPEILYSKNGNSELSTSIEEFIKEQLPKTKDILRAYINKEYSNTEQYSQISNEYAKVIKEYTNKTEEKLKEYINEEYSNTEQYSQISNEYAKVIKQYAKDKTKEKLKKCINNDYQINNNLKQSPNIIINEILTKFNNQSKKSSDSTYVFTAEVIRQYIKIYIINKLFENQKLTETELNFFILFFNFLIKKPQDLVIKKIKEKMDSQIFCDAYTEKETRQHIKRYIINNENLTHSELNFVALFFNEDYVRLFLKTYISKVNKNLTTFELNFILSNKDIKEALLGEIIKKYINEEYPKTEEYAQINKKNANEEYDSIQKTRNRAGDTKNEKIKAKNNRVIKDIKKFIENRLGESNSNRLAFHLISAVRGYIKAQKYLTQLQLNFFTYFIDEEVHTLKQMANICLKKHIIYNLNYEKLTLFQLNLIKNIYNEHDEKVFEALKGYAIRYNLKNSLSSYEKVLAAIFNSYNSKTKKFEKAPAASDTSTKESSNIYTRYVRKNNLSDTVSSNGKSSTTLFNYGNNSKEEKTENASAASSTSDTKVSQNKTPLIQSTQISNDSPKKSLHEELYVVEQRTGNFSHYQYADIEKHNQIISFGKSHDIKLQNKPAYQFLKTAFSNHPLDFSKLLIKRKEKTQEIVFTDATINSFIVNHTKSINQQNKLIIHKERIQELRKSARIFINREILSSQDYKNKCNSYNTHSRGNIIKGNKFSYEDVATCAICHAQKADLLITYKAFSGNAYTCPRAGEIKAGSHAMLILSVPAINYAYDYNSHKTSACNLSLSQQKKLMKNMFQLLFYVTTYYGYQYICLLPAGLGEFIGNENPNEKASMYFESVFNVAKEYPDLKIIYHPAQYKNEFDKISKGYSSIKNVVRAEKDVLHIAQELINDNKPCAVHNPSDADVSYKAADPGEYWKNGKGKRYVAEEHMGVTTTISLNGPGLNPHVYDFPIEVDLTKKRNVDNFTSGYSNNNIHKQDHIEENSNGNVNSFFSTSISKSKENGFNPKQTKVTSLTSD